MTSRLQARLLAQRALFQRLQASKKRSTLQAGFTLIELLIVVVIIGILSSIAIPAFLNQADTARENAAQTAATSAARACAAFLAAGTPGDFEEVANVEPATCAAPTTYTATFGDVTRQATVTAGGGVVIGDGT